MGILLLTRLGVEPLQLRLHAERSETEYGLRDSCIRGKTDFVYSRARAASLLVRLSIKPTCVDSLSPDPNRAVQAGIGLKGGTQPSSSHRAGSSAGG